MHFNLGDDLFMEAFRHLFPDFNFKFVDQIISQDLHNIDAVFIGGGSLLGDALNFKDDNTYQILKNKKIFYLGVGGETQIHPTHYQLIKIAKLIAIRNASQLNKFLKINTNTISIPDLVYCLPVNTKVKPISKSVLIMPNVMVVPQWHDPHWKHVAWNYFKSEFSQFLDEIVQDNFSISFLALCNNSQLNDNLAAAELVNHMQHRNINYFLKAADNFTSAIDVISKYNIVITQRYHGIVLSEMAHAPHISISHHDKLKSSQGSVISFYGITKDKLREQFNYLLHTKVSNYLPIDTYLFEVLKNKVYELLK